jgi:PIN domain nuclease of toxin-antitoxin system
VIVLDTHAWVWFVDDPRQLSAAARKATETARAAGSIVISSISCWEVAMLAAGGRLKLTIDVRDWIAKCEALPFFNFVPVDNAIFARSVFLAGPLHADPADRIIIATALTRDIPIVTKDRKIRNYPRVQSIW